MQEWGTHYIFGIPGNSTAQVVVERSLKSQLTRLREGGDSGTYGMLLAKALVAINHMEGKMTD